MDKKLRPFKTQLDILQKYEWFNSRFNISTLQFLGKGSFGAVFSVFHLKFNRVLAIKVIESETDKLNEIINELVRMKSLNHPNIIEILEHYILIEDDTLYLLLVMEQGLMSLDTYLTDNPNGMPEPELCKLIESLASALSYAHQKRIAHCDIKPGNIIIFPNDPHQKNSSFCYKISDWGSSYEFKEYNHTNTSVKTCMNFTPFFLAPELQMLEEKLGKGDFFLGDIYALGITLAFCAGVGKKELLGFSFEQKKEIYDERLNVLLSRMESKGVSHKTQQKIKKMIAFECHERTLSVEIKNDNNGNEST